MNIIRHVKKLLARENYLLASDRPRRYRLLKNISYELRQLRLQFALHSDSDPYRELEALIIRINNQIHVLPYER